MQGSDNFSYKFTLKFLQKSVFLNKIMDLKK